MMYLRDLWRLRFTDPVLAERIAQIDADGERATGYDADDFRKVALTTAPKGLPAQ